MSKIFFIIIIIYAIKAFGQVPFSSRDNYGFHASIGLSIIELDTTYGTYGMYVRDWNDNNYGIFYAEFLKKNGKLSKIIKFHNDSIQFEFNENNVITKSDSIIEFISAPSNDTHLKIISLVQDSLKFKKIPQIESISQGYIKEVILLNNNKIISSSVYLSNSDKSQLCISFEEDNKKDYTQLLLGDTIEFYNGSGPLSITSNGNILVSMPSAKVSNAQAYLTFYELDSEHNIINQPKTTSIHPLWGISRMLNINYDTIVFTCIKTKLVDFQTKSIPVIVFYDYKKAKILKTLDFNNTIYNSWDEYYKNLKYAHDGNIIYGGEYTYYVPEKDQINRDVVIGKIDKAGKELWRKRYTILEPVINDATFFHWLHDLEPTSDGNYICYGEVWGYTEEAGKPVNEAWLFKINENGDIINIDTTSSTTWINKSSLPITIYPNPATDMIYINQSNVDNITYEVYDLSGRKIKTIDSKEANHSYMMDISDFAQGSYFINIIRDNKTEGILRFEKI